MDTKQCERCHEEKYQTFFRGRSDFLMPWCKECRLADPAGAKRASDRLRQAMMDKKKLKEKNEKRRIRAREIRVEVRSAESTACDLALIALSNIDLSAYSGREKKAIEGELRRISSVIRSMRH